MGAPSAAFCILQKVSA